MRPKIGNSDKASRSVCTEMLHVNNAKDVMASDTSVAELGLLVAPGAVELGKLIDAN